MKQKHRKDKKKKQPTEQEQPILRFDPISPTMLFKSLILLVALVVASVVAINSADSSEIWPFLQNVLIYAALTQQGKQ